MELEAAVDEDTMQIILAELAEPEAQLVEVAVDREQTMALQELAEQELLILAAAAEELA